MKHDLQVKYDLDARVDKHNSAEWRNRYKNKHSIIIQDNFERSVKQFKKVNQSSFDQTSTNQYSSSYNEAAILKSKSNNRYSLKTDNIIDNSNEQNSNQTPTNSSLNKAHFEIKMSDSPNNSNNMQSESVSKSNNSKPLQRQSHNDESNDNQSSSSVNQSYYSQQDNQYDSYPNNQPGNNSPGSNHGYDSTGKQDVLMNMFTKFDTLIMELISEQTNTNNSKVGNSERGVTASTYRKDATNFVLQEKDEDRIKGYSTPRNNDSIDLSMQQSKEQHKVNVDDDSDVFITNMINPSQDNNESELNYQTDTVSNDYGKEERGEHSRPFLTESSIQSKHVPITNKNIIKQLECQRQYKEIELPSILQRDLQDYRSEEDEKVIKSMNSEAQNSDNYSDFKEVKEYLENKYDDSKLCPPFVKHWLKTRNINMKISDLLQFIKTEVRQWGLESKLTDNMFDEFEKINNKTESKNQIKNIIYEQLIKVAYKTKILNKQLNMNNLVSKFSMKKIYPIVEVNEDKNDENITMYKNENKKTNSRKFNQINQLNQSMDIKKDSTWGHLHRINSKNIPNLNKHSFNENTNTKFNTPNQVTKKFSYDLDRYDNKFNNSIDFELTNHKNTKVTNDLFNKNDQLSIFIQEQELEQQVSNPQPANKTFNTQNEHLMTCSERMLVPASSQQLNYVKDNFRHKNQSYFDQIDNEQNKLNEKDKENELKSVNQNFNIDSDSVSKGKNLDNNVERIPYSVKYVAEKNNESKGNNLKKESQKNLISKMSQHQLLKKDLKKENRIMFVKKERGIQVVNQVNFVKQMNNSNQKNETNNSGDEIDKLSQDGNLKYTENTQIKNHNIPKIEQYEHPDENQNDNQIRPDEIIMENELNNMNTESKQEHNYLKDSSKNKNFRQSLSSDFSSINLETHDSKRSSQILNNQQRNSMTKFSKKNLLMTAVNENDNDIEKRDLNDMMSNEHITNHKSDVFKTNGEQEQEQNDTRKASNDTNKKTNHNINKNEYIDSSKKNSDNVTSHVTSVTKEIVKIEQPKQSLEQIKSMDEEKFERDENKQQDPELQYGKLLKKNIDVCDIAFKNLKNKVKNKESKCDKNIKSYSKQNIDSNHSNNIGSKYSSLNSFQKRNDLMKSSKIIKGLHHENMSKKNINSTILNSGNQNSISMNNIDQIYLNKEINF